MEPLKNLQNGADASYSSDNCAALKKLSAGFINGGGSVIAMQKPLFEEDFECGSALYRIRLFREGIKFLKKTVEVIHKALPPNASVSSIMSPRHKPVWEELSGSVDFVVNSQLYPITEHQLSLGADRTFCIRKLDKHTIIYVMHGPFVRCFDRNYRFDLKDNSKYEWGYLHNQGEEVLWIGFRDPSNLRGGLLHEVHNITNVVGCLSASKNVSLLLDGAVETFCG